MTQQDKDLLLRDLSARLTYGVYVYANGMGCYKLSSIELYKGNVIIEINEETLSYHLYEIKPYLRPMSSMTREEKIKIACMADFNKCTKSIEIIECSIPIIDFCYSRHLDIHGLIHKGLAIEAPQDLYNF